MEPLCTIGANTEWYSAVENSVVAPQKIRRKITIRPRHSTPGHVPKRIERSLKEAFAHVDSILFAMAETWKPPKRPSAGEWIRKMWCFWMME